MQLPRRTLRAPAAYAGVTLFTAARAQLSIQPAPMGTGLVFRRTDLPGHPSIPALHTHIVPESRRTVLSADPANSSAPTVQTTEHILSALVGLGITDAFIDLAGPEAPIGDGSALMFVQAIHAAGIHDLGSCPTRVIIINDELRLADPANPDSGWSIRAAPLPTGGTPKLELTYQLNYGDTAPIPRAAAIATLPLHSPCPTYSDLIAPARTFSLLHEVQMAQKMGLFNHLSPKDMLVIGPDGPIENAYRFPDEPARHKLLDLIGDLALTGLPIVGRIMVSKTGHAHNHTLAAKLAKLAE